jgi:hypothetical protein
VLKCKCFFVSDLDIELDIDLDVEVDIDLDVDLGIEFLYCSEDGAS